MEIIDIGRVRICVSATRVDGVDNVDIRAYKTDNQGRLMPTKTGILIPVHHLSAVLDAAKVEYASALEREPAFLYYFKERVEDKNAPRLVHSWSVSSSAREAVGKTPEEYGAEKQRGYIFKCNAYERLTASIKFEPTRPYAVWDRDRDKWVRWKNRK